MLPPNETGQRTYYISVSGTATPSQVISIPFEDTSGNVIRCNYFKLTGAVSLASSLMSVVAEPSGVSRRGDMVLSLLSAIKDVTALNGSGILGIGGVTCGGSIQEVWHGSNGEICTGIRLQVNATGSWYVGITYGNLLPFNTLRATAASIVNPGVSTGSYDRGI